MTCDPNKVGVNFLFWVPISKTPERLNDRTIEYASNNSISIEQVLFSEIEEIHNPPIESDGFHANVRKTIGCTGKNSNARIGSVFTWQRRYSHFYLLIRRSKEMDILMIIRIIAFIHAAVHSPWTSLKILSCCRYCCRCRCRCRCRYEVCSCNQNTCEACKFRK